MYNYTVVGKSESYNFEDIESNQPINIGDTIKIYEFDLGKMMVKVVNKLFLDFDETILQVEEVVN